MASRPTPQSADETMDAHAFPHEGSDRSQLIPQQSPGAERPSNSDFVNYTIGSMLDDPQLLDIPAPSGPARSPATNEDALLLPRPTMGRTRTSSTAADSCDTGSRSPLSANAYSSLLPSATSMTSISRGAQSSMSQGVKMPEFFGFTVFQTAMCNPTIAHQLLKFSEACLCGENMDFLARVSKYHLLVGEISKSITAIQKDFLTPASPHQVNLSEQLEARINFEIKQCLSNTIPAIGSIFSDAEDEIERLVYTDVYPRFVRHQMSLSAAKALGGNSKAYAGLGDCFILTDPNKADGPIVYASDGFVSVTGYSRNEVIPRNCRFLQGRQTDRAAIGRLKAALEKRKEHVELLLNHKKSGEPFWNLLYVAPLFDSNGKLVFFLGGQINCSTTVHNASDVLRVLGQAEDGQRAPAGTDRRSITSVPSNLKSSLLTTLRGVRAKTKVQEELPGMEDELLSRIGQQDLSTQMRTFYTAYSNFLIINYSTFLITFFSQGITELLFPIKTRSNSSSNVGVDIFKFLSNHSSASVSRDFKTGVREALKAGRAISLEMKLCAKPYMGLESFVLHWTPLKDEAGVVKWVVLTLGRETKG
ncbi:hypothetical protein KC347_g419 [Hortaea werneckii]|nr:hypothetical protein KC347_g419 [Hortaea werneckii]